MSEELIRELYKEFRDFRGESNQKMDSMNDTITKVEKSCALMGKDIEFIKKEDAHQNQILSKQQEQIDEHVQGTIQVREQNNMRYKEIIEKLESDKKLRDKQIDLLEETNDELRKEVVKLKRPMMWVKMTLGVIGSVGLVSGAVWTIMKIVEDLTTMGLF